MLVIVQHLLITQKMSSKLLLPDDHHPSTYVVVVGEVDLGPDDADVEFVVDPALAEACVEDGGLVARVGSNKEDLRSFKLIT